MDGMEYQLIEAVFEAKHSLHRVIHFAKAVSYTHLDVYKRQQLRFHEEFRCRR